MKLLIVADSESVHTARWIRAITDEFPNIHLFPCHDVDKLHSELEGVIIHNSFYRGSNKNRNNVRFRGIRIRGAAYLRDFYKKFKPDYRQMQLAKLISRHSPEIVHSIGTLSAGYLLSCALASVKSDNMPTWIHSTLGSDLFLFGTLPDHKSKVKAVMAGCDFLVCEGRRDANLASDFGYKGKEPMCCPSGGGLNLEKIYQANSALLLPSERKIIMLKGNHGCTGRALTGLRALSLCSGKLEEFKLVIYSATPEVELSAEIFSHSTGIETTIIPNGSPSDTIIKFLGQSRIHIGLSISDGIPYSILESMAMGAFPIQSNTSMAEDWMRKGESCLIVPPEDPEIIASAIEKAIESDELVNSAFKINKKSIATNGDNKILGTKIRHFYKKILSER